MYIQDILSTEQSEYVSSLTKKSDKDNDAESSISSPLSWGADTVSISAEARAAQQSAAAGDQNKGQSQKGDEEESEEDATAAFGEFMDKAKGTKVASDPSEQIEALKSKLVQLQNKKAQILSSQGLGEEAKQSQANAIDGQINQIIAMIAELETQMSQAA